MPAIITERHVSDAADVAHQLHTAFRLALQDPLVRGLRASVLAERLGVGRMTCQRIVRLAEIVEPSPDLLTLIPGVQGLRQFMSGMRAAGAAGDPLRAADAAIDALDRFLGEVGLSHTGLASALALHLEAADPAQQLARRKKLYDAASSLMGQSAGTTISMMAFRFSPQQGFNFEQIAVRGYAQMRAAGSAMPIRLPMNAALSDFRRVGGQEASRAPQHLIERFCSTPLPSIDARVIKEKHLAHIINVEDIPTGEPFDCFASQHSRWNINDPGKHKSIWLYIDYPTRRCIFDVYLHADLDRPHRVSADTHLWGTSLLAPPEDLWMTQFAESLQFTALGAGSANAASTSHPTHGELTRYMFDHHGWDASEFVGYRCEIEMPIWRSGVCIVLEER